MTVTIITITIQSGYPVPAQFLDKAPVTLIETVVKDAIDQQVAAAYATGANRPYIGSPDHLRVKVVKKDVEL